MSPFRDLWTEAMVTLGGLGYRSRTTRTGLIAHRPDGSTLRVDVDHLAIDFAHPTLVTITLLSRTGVSRGSRKTVTESPVTVLDQLLKLDAEHPPRVADTRSSMKPSWSPPADRVS